MFLGVTMGASLTWGSTSTNEPDLTKDQLLLPWADCNVSINELIGEDSPVIISLDVGQLMVRLDVVA